jgi:hypothetical protein
MHNVSGGYADNGGSTQRDDDPAVSYEAAVPGTPVLSASGSEIGTLEHVLEVPELGLFDGIVIATDWGLRFIDADQVEVITIRHLRCRIAEPAAACFPPPDGSPVYRVNVLEEIGDSLHERLGQMFHRPYWTSELSAGPSAGGGPGFSRRRRRGCRAPGRAPAPSPASRPASR